MKAYRLLSASLLLGFAGFAQALSVPVIDPSFENPTRDPIAFAVGNTGLPGSWFTDDTTKARRMDVIPGSFWGSMINRDGNRAAFAAQFNEVPVSERGASLYQTVALTAGTTYTLTVGVGTGKGSFGDGTGNVSKNDARFAIALGNVPVPTSSGLPVHSSSADVLVETTGVIPNMNGFFTDYIVSFTPTVTKNYNIILSNRGWVPDTGALGITSTVFFDNVRLTYVPEPSSILLLAGSGVMTLVGRRRRA